MKNRLLRLLLTATAVLIFGWNAAAQITTHVTHCKGKNDGRIDVTVENAATSVRAVWSDGGFGLSRTGLKAGNYTVTVTSGTCCEYVTSAKVVCCDGNSPFIYIQEIQHAKVIEDLNRPKITQRGAVTIGADGTGVGYTYQWSNGATGATVTNLAPGTYTVTVTDLGSGCVKSLPVTIENCYNSDPNSTWEVRIVGGLAAAGATTVSAKLLYRANASQDWSPFPNSGYQVRWLLNGAPVESTGAAVTVSTAAAWPVGGSVYPALKAIVSDGCGGKKAMKFIY